MWDGTTVEIVVRSGTVTVWFPDKYDPDCGGEITGAGYFDPAFPYPYHNEHILLNYLRLTYLGPATP
jgi:hypothetical protein